jgi:hypothetical protein
MRGSVHGKSDLVDHNEENKGHREVPVEHGKNGKDQRSFAWVRRSVEDGFRSCCLSERQRTDANACAKSTKAGVTGSSPVLPTSESPASPEGFRLFCAWNGTAGSKVERREKSCAIRHLMTSRLAPGTDRRCECWEGPA